jgi:predicted secreted protein
MWLKRKPRKDPRSGRIVFVIECLLNQNARDRGAANSAAVTRQVIDVLADAGIGMAQIPCPEIACLGFRRERPPGVSIREALEAPGAVQGCRQLAKTTADRIQCYLDEKMDVVAILGGNEQSPGCAVHVAGDDDTRLTAKSGAFMLALAEELDRRGLRVRFHGMRDIDPALLQDDIDWLRNHAG